MYKNATLLSREAIVFFQASYDLSLEQYLAYCPRVKI